MNCENVSDQKGIDVRTIVVHIHCTCTQIGAKSP